MVATDPRPWPDRAWSEVTPGGHPNSAIIYYKPDDEESTKLINEMEKATERLMGFSFLQGLKQGYKKHLKLSKVDVTKYAEDKTKARMPDSDVPGLFITIGGTYEHAKKEKFGTLTAEKIADYIYGEAVEEVPSKVKPWVSEDGLWDLITAETPALVAFCEDNSGCERLARPFNRSSAFHDGQLHHVWCKCSESEQSKQFCSDQEIQQHPTINLYTEDGEVNTFAGVKTLRALQEFVGLHCSTCKKPAEGMGS
jgi:hypothetical protein